MKLREQAALCCKMLALFSGMLGINTLQQTVPQAISMMGIRGGGGTPGIGMLIGMSAPAMLMCAFGALLWIISPFVAALMVPDTTLRRIENHDSPEIVHSPTFGARDAMTIALVLLGLWMWLQSVAAIGRVVVLRATIETVPAAQSAGMLPFYGHQMNLEIVGAAVQFIFGAIVLFGARPLARRTFPVA